MKKITVHPLVLASLLLVATCTGAAVGGWAGFAKGRIEGTMVGQLKGHREVFGALSTLMSQGMVVRHADGSDKRYVLKPVATTD